MLAPTTVPNLEEQRNKSRPCAEAESVSDSDADADADSNSVEDSKVAQSSLGSKNSSRDLRSIEFESKSEDLGNEVEVVENMWTRRDYADEAGTGAGVWDLGLTVSLGTVVRRLLVSHLHNFKGQRILTYCSCHTPPSYRRGCCCLSPL